MSVALVMVSGLDMSPGFAHARTCIFDFELSNSDTTFFEHTGSLALCLRDCSHPLHKGAEVELISRLLDEAEPTLLPHPSPLHTGLSGSGKTTMLATLCGEEAPAPAPTNGFAIKVCDIFSSH